MYVSGFGDKKTLGGILKFGQERWQNITPKAAGRPWDYCGITVDPTDPQTILAAPASHNFPTPIFRSQDAGKSWHPLTIQRSAEVPWWPQRFVTDPTSALVIAHPHPNTRGLLEVRNLGLLPFQVCDEAPVALVLVLDPQAPRFVEAPESAARAGITVPLLRLYPDGPVQHLKAELALERYGLA